MYNDSIVVYEKATELTEGPGINFLTNGSLIMRMNAAWCGTPPITYTNYSGTYTMSDSILSISAGYWGGQSYHTWRLISLKKNTLTIKIMSEGYGNQ